MPFDHPLWVLYSSGTTGLPKAIVQGQGGILLEHLKKLHLHVDAQAGDRVFWFTTTGWMMWNFLVSGLLTEAAIVLYDGSPAEPDMDVLWDLAAAGRRDDLRHERRVHRRVHEGRRRAGRRPRPVRPARRRLDRLAAVAGGLPAGSTTTSASDTWLFSTSGGTDLCTAFVGGCPIVPVYEGELQARSLGASVEAWDPEGRPLVGEVGELVITEPMPSMPLYLWNDPDGERYRDSYFSTYPGIWRHGDWIEITERGTAIISGRSDSTINRGGVRMGTAEIYRAVLAVDEVVDALVVDVPREGGEDWMPLFVVLREGDRARRGPGEAHPHAHPRGRLAAPRPERDRGREGGPAHAVGQGARAAGQADPDGHAAGEGGEPRLAGEPGGAGLLRQLGGAPLARRRRMRSLAATFSSNVRVLRSRGVAPSAEPMCVARAESFLKSRSSDLRCKNGILMVSG